MKHVTFPDGRSVPALGMGSWRLGQGRHSPQAEEAAIRLGLDLGLRLIDTAEMYGRGRSEQLIGRAISGRRDEAFLVSKVFPWNANRLLIERACHASLRRLGVEQLDLYLLHWHAGAILSEAVRCFERLRAQGKIRAWGVSNLDTPAMQRLHSLPRGNACATDQVLYNIGVRGPEYDLLPWCAAQGMPVMAYSPLGGKGNELLRAPVLAAIARKHGVSPAAIAMAWAIRQGNVIAIPESGDAAHVRANAAVLDLVLEPDDLAAIDAAFPPPLRKAKLATL